jgi:hypothetical protein
MVSFYIFWLVVGVTTLLFCLFIFAPWEHWFRQWHCYRGHHTVGRTTNYDGCSFHSKCKWCNYEGIIDNQSNFKS